MFKYSKGRQEKRKKLRLETTNRKYNNKKMADLGTKISIITLHGNGQNIPIKRQTLAELI